MLDREVWPDEELAAQIAENFVPLMIYDHKDRDTLRKYNVRAFPTFVVTDAEGKEEMRRVGAPFRTPDEARKWFAAILDGLDSLEAREKAHADDPENVDLAHELAETYDALGQAEKAAPLYDKLAEALDKEDKRYVGVRLKQADGILETLTRENQAEVGEKVGKIYDEILPGLIKAKDDRAIDPGITNARIKAIVGEDTDAARKQMLELAEAFPEHDRNLEIKFFAAAIAQHGGEADTARAEFKKIVEQGPEDNRWVQAAKQALERMDE
jgi:tetratricopeptide (TPR) repeat protein